MGESHPASLDTVLTASVQRFVMRLSRWIVVRFLLTVERDEWTGAHSVPVGDNYAVRKCQNQDIQESSRFTNLGNQTRETYLK